MNRVVINGKFLAQPLTGVQRAAGELLMALDAVLDEALGEALDEARDAAPVSDRAAGPLAPQPSWHVALPPGVAHPPWRRLQPWPVPAPWGLHSLHAWEQWALPRAARGALLLNLSGSAPWLGARTSVAMLHDAAVFEHPQAYTAAFVAWYRLLFRRLAQQAALVLTPSQFSAQRLAFHLGVPEARFRLQPLGADHLGRGMSTPAEAASAWPLPQLPPGTPFLLAVGSRNPTKNLARVAQAFAQVSATRPQLHLVLVGEARATVFRSDGPNGSSALLPRVHRLGRVDDGQLLALYRHARALIFPSLTEGFGLPPLEAMHAGCPVVASHHGALAEVCGDAALVVDPLSVDDIASAMQRVLDDGPLTARLQAAGRAQASRWRWAQAGCKLRRHVEQCLGACRTWGTDGEN